MNTAMLQWTRRFGDFLRFGGRGAYVSIAATTLTIFILLVPLVGQAMIGIAMALLLPLHIIPTMTYDVELFSSSYVVLPLIPFLLAVGGLAPVPRLRRLGREAGIGMCFYIIAASHLPAMAACGIMLIIDPEAMSLSVYILQIIVNSTIINATVATACLLPAGMRSAACLISLRMLLMMYVLPRAYHAVHLETMFALACVPILLAVNMSHGSSQHPN